MPPQNESRKSMKMARACIAFVVVFEILVLSTVLAASDEEQECAIAAFADYNNANLDLLTKDDLLPSVETLIAQRRLQEEYCLRSSKCSMGHIPEQGRDLVLRTKFASCLEEEALEKYEAIRKDGQ
jgi:hypothetical protein